jgi:hypothetical protein
MSILSYDEVKDNQEVLIAMTGLTQEEFAKLLPVFEEAYKDSLKDKSSQGRKSNLLKIEDKLFFILFYVKTYPLQEVIAFLFGMSQSQANEWIHRLSSVLKVALDKGGYMPERVGSHLKETLEGMNDTKLVIDGTERRRQRPKDGEAQKAYYSGKKKLIPIRIIS